MLLKGTILKLFKHRLIELKTLPVIKWCKEEKAAFWLNPKDCMVWARKAKASRWNKTFWKSILRGRSLAILLPFLRIRKRKWRFKNTNTCSHWSIWQIVKSRASSTMSWTKPIYSLKKSWKSQVFLSKEQLNWFRRSDLIESKLITSMLCDKKSLHNYKI